MKIKDNLYAAAFVCIYNPKEFKIDTSSSHLTLPISIPYCSPDLHPRNQSSKCASSLFSSSAWPQLSPMFTLCLRYPMTLLAYVCVGTSQSHVHLDGRQLRLIQAIRYVMYRKKKTFILPLYCLITSQNCWTCCTE